jgi:pyruvate kinase
MVMTGTIVEGREVRPALGDGAPGGGAMPGTVPARHTKIIATLGPATDRPGMLDALLEAGMDCARLNCSHGSPDDLRRRARAVREAARRADRAAAVLVDLQGPKIRLAPETVPGAVAAGEVVVFASRGRRADPEHVVVELPGFEGLISERSQVVIGDGTPRFAVDRVAEGGVWARAVAPGAIGPRKGISVSHARPSLPAMTEKDLADLDVAVAEDDDFVALSFVRCAADVEELRARLRERGSRARLIAKVEKVEALACLEEIVAAADGIMVARGDYGVEAGVQDVPLMQKGVIRSATEAGKLVITATQMLESMVAAAEPTRAEACDVANAVIDGTSAVMLSGETATGAYPVEAVRWLARIAGAAERAPGIAGAGGPAAADGPDAAVLRAAVDLATHTGAAALIVPTASGGAARACAKYRARVPVIALTHDPRIADQLALEWGVLATTLAHATSVEDLIGSAIERATEAAGLHPSARVVLTAGSQVGASGATNLIVLRGVR